MIKPEYNISLKQENTLGLPVTAATLIRIKSEADLQAFIKDPDYQGRPRMVWGGGSNVVAPPTIRSVVLKVEILGRRVVQTHDDRWIIEAGAGESWPDLVAWSLSNEIPGLENLALIPGTLGAAPVQNIGAYGVELKDRFESLVALDLVSGRTLTLNGRQCRFGYRDSIFKQALAGRCVITRVRLGLPKAWRAVLDYPDLKRYFVENKMDRPQARQIFEQVCRLRQEKLPDPKESGNVGSFFKNPVVDRNTRDRIRDLHPRAISFPMPDGTFKISAGGLIEACGWKGKGMGNVGVYHKQALVLVNHGNASREEVMALAGAIQTSVRDRFGVSLEIEPTIL